MAEQAFALYTLATKNMVNGLIDLDTATFVMTLHTTSYTPNLNTHETWADVSATELTTALGYTAGGVALTSVTSTTSGGTYTFDCADPSWASFSAVFRYAIITQRAGGSLTSTDKLVGHFDMTGSGSVTGGGGTLTVTINAAGVFTITHTP